MTKNIIACIINIIVCIRVTSNQVEAFLQDGLIIVVKKIFKMGQFFEIQLLWIIQINRQ